MKAIKYRCAQMKRNYSLQKKESQSVDTTYIKNVKKKKSFQTAQQQYTL